MKNNNLTILYLHGGAYVHNITKQHWAFLDKIIERTNATVIVPDYPLAPKYNYEDAFEMISIYKEILVNVSTNKIVFMGDSAGGGFTLSLAQYLKTRNIPQPDKCILLSPWLDLTLSNPEIDFLTN